MSSDGALATLPPGSPAVVRAALLALVDDVQGEEIRVRETGGGGARVFHVAVVDLARWTDPSVPGPRETGDSTWLRAIARDAAHAEIECLWIRSMERAYELGLWSRATMREVLAYCLARLADAMRS